MVFTLVLALNAALVKSCELRLDVSLTKLLLDRLEQTDTLSYNERRTHRLISLKDPVSCYAIRGVSTHAKSFAPPCLT